MNGVKNRLIATLLVDRGQIVQTRRFKKTNPVGSPFTAVDFFNSWAVDEIAILDISNSLDTRERFFELIDELSRRCFVPLTVGGKIGDTETITKLTRIGADKVVINSEAVRKPRLIEQAADQFGSQCIVVSIDGKINGEMVSGYEVIVDNGREATGLDLLEWSNTAVSLGAGELLINQIEHDGDRRGYDLELIKLLSSTQAVPVIAMGGVGEWQHLVAGIEQGGADAVAAGNIFHYTEHSTKKAKEFLMAADLFVRKPDFYKVAMPRRPRYRPF